MNNVERSLMRAQMRLLDVSNDYMRFYDLAQRLYKKRKELRFSGYSDDHVYWMYTRIAGDNIIPKVASIISSAIDEARVCDYTCANGSVWKVWYDLITNKLINTAEDLMTGILDCSKKTVDICGINRKTPVNEWGLPVKHKFTAPEHYLFEFFIKFLLDVPYDRIEQKELVTLITRDTHRKIKVTAVRTNTGGIIDSHPFIFFDYERWVDANALCSDPLKYLGLYTRLSRFQEKHLKRFQEAIEFYGKILTTKGNTNEQQ